MSFKKKYDYILQHEVDITIYDRLRELVKEFGEEPMFHGYISSRCDEEKKFHINNRNLIDRELQAMEYIEDELMHDLAHEIKKRREKLNKIKEYTENRFILDDKIYQKSVDYRGSIWFTTDDSSRGVHALVDYHSIETKEPYYKVRLTKRKESDSFGTDSVNIGTNFTYDEVNTIIKHYIIDNKFTFDKDYCETEEGKRDLSITVLTDILNG